MLITTTLILASFRIATILMIISGYARSLVNIARQQGKLPVLRVLSGSSFDEVEKVLENLKDIDGIKLGLSPELYAKIKDNPGAAEFFREFKANLQLPVSPLDGVMPSSAIREIQQMQQDLTISPT